MLYKILLGITIFFVAIQLIRPSKNISNQPIITSDLAIDDATLQILDKACFDCHSAYTRYKWYAEINPIGWLIAHDIEEGRAELDFSQWKSYSEKKKKHKLDEIADEVSEHKMPESLYLVTHGEAKLTQQEIDLIVGWAKK